ncbi:metallophosphoesterase family protein [Clostridium taeniosporum]|uniref:DNA repair exonuclease n=1 Tax=Clostridium taeniosporum TaxID=394958 RepID=A0A1D7XH63_9CLOT|nr:metallophosphoesterase [Clostridium taeniosporum]AOR22652.1 DNA repair exonuclease [Clostridium taeniosporum]
MKKIKILHTSDLHFDTPFSGMKNNESIKCREELKEVFERIIKISLENHIDILLIAGDMFDNLLVNKSTLYFLKKCFESINKVRVFISPGNHDPYNEKSFYSMIEWPENVYIFKGNIEKIVLEDLQTIVWGAAFTKTYINESLIKGANGIEGYNNIMVIHGELCSSKEKNEYNPITEDDIARSDMDYIALGHRHKYVGVNKALNTYYAYSGCPQGRGFDELGDKGVLLLELCNGYCDYKFIKTSIRNYYEKEINIEEYFGYNQVKNKILSFIDKEDIKFNSYKVILTGEISEEFNLREDILEELIRKDSYDIKLVDKTEIKIDIDELLNGYSIKSLFARKIYEEIEKSETEEEKEILKLALKKGLQSLTGEEVRDYIN